MTKKRMTLLVFGAALIALIILLTALRADKDTTRANKDTTLSPSPFPLIIDLSENQQIEAIVDGDTLDTREGNAPDRVIARKNDATRITLRTADELAAFLARANPYRYSAYFSQEDVPALMALLEDPKYVHEWATAMIIVAWVDEQGLLQPHLIQYLKTDYSGVIHERREKDANKYTRYTALMMLGIVADERGIELLKTIALSDEGLYSVTADWLGKWPRSWRDLGGRHEGYVGALRGKAVRGLVYSQNQSSIALVEELHAETVDAIYTAARAHNMGTREYFDSSSVFDRERIILKKLYYSLVSGLAARDAIEDMGFAEFHSAIATMDGAMDVIGSYSQKYEMKFE
ncbi:MAG: hypothetical protein IID08_07070 [Candidatus Hydrogenedentes bacterium]|nr:hypothetical protein [Candidatus Hydrogenedentota bacterium]